MHTGKQKQMNAPYQASLVNRHIRRFTGILTRFLFVGILSTVALLVPIDLAVSYFRDTSVGNSSKVIHP